MNIQLFKSVHTVGRGECQILPMISPQSEPTYRFPPKIFRQMYQDHSCTFRIFNEINRKCKINPPSPAQVGHSRFAEADALIAAFPAIVDRCHHFRLSTALLSSGFSTKRWTSAPQNIKILKYLWFFLMFDWLNCQILPSYLSGRSEISTGPRMSISSPSR